VPLASRSDVSVGISNASKLLRPARFAWPHALGVSTRGLLACRRRSDSRAVDWGMRCGPSYGSDTGRTRRSSTGRCTAIRPQKGPATSGSGCRWTCNGCCPRMPRGHEQRAPKSCTCCMAEDRRRKSHEQSNRLKGEKARITRVMEIPQ